MSKKRDWTDEERAALRYGWGQGMHSIMSSILDQIDTGIFPKNIESRVRPLLQRKMDWVERDMLNSPDPREE